MMDRVQKDTFNQHITPLSKILNLIVLAFCWFLFALLFNPEGGVIMDLKYE
jgi:hypothetical protein